MNVLRPAAETALDPAKFQDPDVTAKGEPRAFITATRLATLWFNTGTLCNLTCEGCYIESSPTNDRLAYLSIAEVTGYLDEIEASGMDTEEIGFTGGEPFMNPDLVAMMEVALERGFRVLVLTNAMRPMMKCADRLAGLVARHGKKLVVRVSLDHYSAPLHESLRGAHSWRRTLDGIRWLVATGATIHIAGRTCWGDSEDRMREGYARLFAAEGIPVDAGDRTSLTLFPEMDESQDIAEITTGCWDLLGIAPEAMMCATSRMVVKHKGEDRPVVVPCTLLPYDRQFDMGHHIADAMKPVKLNHPHCARFCVLGGGSCSHAG